MLRYILKSLFTAYLFFTIYSIHSEISPDQLRLLEQLPPDQRNSIQEKMEMADDLGEEIEDAFEDSPSLIKKIEKDKDIDSDSFCPDCIFGYEYFINSPSTFAPNSNSPVPSNYILGPGDKLEINLYGNEQKKSVVTISREGTLNLPLLGPVNLLGLEFGEAIQIIRKKVVNELIGTDVSVSLADVRSINVFLLGEAYQPGVYTMSGLSSITSALFVTGGVNEKGSLREIQLKRNGELISNYDFYEFLLSGNTNDDVKLQNGDVIFIPFIENKVDLGGEFKRPHLYEFREGETINDAIRLAGGFKSEIEPSKIELNTINSERERILIYLENQPNNLNRKLKDGDMINVSSLSSIATASIKLTGQFKNPGVYSILPGETVLDIITRAGGYTEEAYTEGAVFLRESVAKSQKEAFMRSAEELEKTMVEVITKGVLTNIAEFTLLPISNLIERLREEEPLGRMVVNIDILELRTDPESNFNVRDGDTIHIPERPSSVSVVGEVLNSSTLSYNAKQDIEGYIELAGGLSESADKNRIFVIEPNGQSKMLNRGLFSSSNIVLPGSTIVVSRDSRPFDAVNLTQIITPVLADLATSAAAIAALND